MIPATYIFGGLAAYLLLSRRAAALGTPSASAGELVAKWQGKRVEEVPPADIDALRAHAKSFTDSAPRGGHMGYVLTPVLPGTVPTAKNAEIIFLREKPEERANEVQHLRNIANPASWTSGKLLWRQEVRGQQLSALDRLAGQIEKDPVGAILGGVAHDTNPPKIPGLPL